MALKPWIEAMRLRTLPVSIAGIVTTIGYNLWFDNLACTPVIICMAFALLCQIASNFANEYFDYKAGRDKTGREGPRRGVTEGDITPGAMKAATYVTLLLAAMAGLSLIYWGGWWLIAAGVAILAGVFAYSTGHYPLSTKGFGEVAVILFFGLIPVNLTYYIETHLWSLPVLLGSISVGLLGANVLIVNNYRDIEDDRTVNKLTLAVRFGRKAMIALYLFNNWVAMALMLPMWMAIGTAWCAVPVGVAMAAIFITRAMTRRQGAALTPLLGMTAMLMCVYSLLFAVATAIS